jgi:PadR family transcriptional regulator PadR
MDANCGMRQLRHLKTVSAATQGDISTGVNVSYASERTLRWGIGKRRVQQSSRHSTPHGGSVSTSMLGRQGYKNRIELLQGTLDMLILRTLQWGPSHGYGIVQALRTHSGETLQVETGSLYPALHRLERQGWVESEWKQTESNQRARFYSITAAGRKQLHDDLGRWKQMVDAIGSILYREPEGDEA